MRATRINLGCFNPVATQITVVGDGVVEPFAEVFQITLEGGARCLYFGQQDSKADDLVGAQQFVDFLKPFCAVHCVSLIDTKACWGACPHRLKLTRPVAPLNSYVLYSDQRTLYKG